LAAHATNPAEIQTNPDVLRKVLVFLANAMRAKMNITSAARTKRRRIVVSFLKQQIRH